MSYFDDIEDNHYNYYSRILLSCKRRPEKVHYTGESFVENIDGRFAMRKTICGLEFSQSSGRVTPKHKRVTCKDCIRRENLKTDGRRPIQT